jgi:hypothetical protein
VRQYVLITLTLFASSSGCFACDCLWQGSFIKAAPRADLIVSGSVEQIKGNAIDLKINRTIKGKEHKETIRIWGDDGKQCRPEVNTFTQHKQWLMALYKITEDSPGRFNPNTPNISYGRIGDYYISKCGAYWLSVHDNFVSGNLVKGQRWQWADKKMNPVLLDLVSSFINGMLSEQAIAEAAKPQTASKELMNNTMKFLREQR